LSAPEKLEKRGEKEDRSQCIGVADVHDFEQAETRIVKMSNWQFSVENGREVCIIRVGGEEGKGGVRVGNGRNGATWETPLFFLRTPVKDELENISPYRGRTRVH